MHFSAKNSGFKYVKRFDISKNLRKLFLQLGDCFPQLLNSRSAELFNNVYFAALGKRFHTTLCLLQSVSTQLRTDRPKSRSSLTQYFPTDRASLHPHTLTHEKQMGAYRYEA